MTRGYVESVPACRTSPLQRRAGKLAIALLDRGILKLTGLADEPRREGRGALSAKFQDSDQRPGVFPVRRSGI